jgi:hypothetical protein
MPINYKEYHPKWRLISYLIRKVRAKDRCEFEVQDPDGSFNRCTAINGEAHPITGSRVVLTVAHLDHNKQHNKFWNLRAGCQRCHLNYDRGRHVENRKYGRNSRMYQITLKI